MQYNDRRRLAEFSLDEQRRTAEEDLARKRHWEADDREGARADGDGLRNRISTILRRSATLSVPDRAVDQVSMTHL